MPKIKILNKTTSICNVCFKTIDAQTFEKENRVYIKKKCAKHGEFISPHVWDDTDTYKFLIKFKKFNFPSRKALLNLTNKCNLNCKFCYARANDLEAKELKLEDIKKLNLKNYNYIFLSGGEPTIKNDLFDIIKYLKRKKKIVFLLTNGLKLKNKEYSEKLKKTGVDMIILQFDSLNEKNINYLRGVPLLETKLQVLKNLSEINLPVYFFSIQLKKDNIRDMNKLVEYFRKYNNIIKGINFNTIWKIGRYKDEEWMSTKEITDNSCQVIGVEKNDYLQSTEFIYYLFAFISSIKNKRRYFSRCLLFLLVIFDGKKAIPITKIFNLKKITRYLKEITVENKKIKLFNLIFFVIFYQFFINFFINKNFRILIKELIKRLKYIFSKNQFLLNPFTTFNVGEFPNAEDFDYNFVSTCNLHNYSPDGKIEPVCLNQIKFASKKYPLC